MVTLSMPNLEVGLDSANGKGSMASYLQPIVRNAYKPFGWGVDEAVEQLEASARETSDEAGPRIEDLESSEASEPVVAEETGDAEDKAATPEETAVQSTQWVCSFSSLRAPINKNQFSSVHRTSGCLVTAVAYYKVVARLPRAKSLMKSGMYHLLVRNRWLASDVPSAFFCSPAPPTLRSPPTSLPRYVPSMQLNHGTKRKLNRLPGAVVGSTGYFHFW